MWVGNSPTEAPFWRDCCKCHADRRALARVDCFDEDERGVSDWEIPLCPGLGHI